MGNHGRPAVPGSGYLRAFLGCHSARLAQAWREKDRGASAVELAVITAVLLLVAIALLIVIKTFVLNQANKIGNANVPAG